MADYVTATLLFVIVVLSTGTLSARDQSCLTYSYVKLPGGTVRGEWLSSDGVDGPFCFASFMGIPYADPPTDEFRFKAPLTPPSPWHDYKALKKEPVFCPQLTFPDGKLVGDEDCLYLNVYTTNPDILGIDKMPVMVYIHGGGFTFGSGNGKDSGPEFLVSNNVVLVTLNYRLGPLGFLSMDNEDLPGNNGLKDQQAALFWVKENIHLFGGNPAMITIFGNSAGAASCHYHTLNFKSSRLISSAILQSGTAIATWAYTEDHVRRARLLAENFGASPDASPKQIYRLLRSIKALDLVVGAFNITKTDAILKASSLPPFVPSPEKRNFHSSICSEPVFMHHDPEYQMLQLNEDPVPMVLGINKDEGLFAYYYTGMVSNPAAVDIVNKHLELLLPVSLTPNADTARMYSVSSKFNISKMTEAAKAVRDAYNKGGDFDVHNKTSFIKYLGDIFTANDVHRLASLYQYHDTRQPLYLYFFNVDGEYNFGKATLSIGVPGVTHTDELGYMFKVTEPNLKQDILANSTSSRALRFITSSWTQFAKTWRPTTQYSRFWRPVHGPPSTEKPFLYIGNDRIEVVNLTMAEPWDRLYTMFRTPNTKLDERFKT